MRTINFVTPRFDAMRCPRKRNLIHPQRIDSIGGVYADGRGVQGLKLPRPNKFKSLECHVRRGMTRCFAYPSYSKTTIKRHEGIIEATYIKSSHSVAILPLLFLFALNTIIWIFEFVRSHNGRFVLLDS